MTKTILIVDNEPKIVQICHNCFIAAGFNVIRAETGPMGLAASRRDRPDLIVLDLMLPEMDGLISIQHQNLLESPPKKIT
ncbi:MAG: response regulator [Anaerolineae bacterium]|nr:response regulator [Anaerolineae bacterium]